MFLQYTTLYTQSALRYATVSLGPLLFALPLEERGSDWQYALVRNQSLRLTRHGLMPDPWLWWVAPCSIPTISWMPLVRL
eukprot:COSAG05_NODE_1023_length_6126_cov_6.196117_2_plen_80_part_00